MRFAHDTEPALRAAVRLVNTAGEPDALTTLAQAKEFYRSEGYTGRRPRTLSDLAALQAVRPRVRRLLTADRDDAATQVNQILSQVATEPRLRRHDDLDWHLHVVDDDSPFDSRVLVETAMAVIDLIRADELSRLSICEADGCDGLVLDLTRNRSKIFCSPTCSNGAAVAAYRERRRRG